MSSSFDDAFSDLYEVDPSPPPPPFVPPSQAYDDVCIDPIFDMSVEAQERIARMFPGDAPSELDEFVDALVP